MLLRLYACLLFWLMPSAWAQAVLENMRYVSHPDRVQIVLELSRDVPVQHFLLDSPPRIVLDLEQMQQRKRAGLNVHTGAVNLVRTGQPSRHTLRVVIDLKQQTGYRVLRQQYGKGKIRLLVDVLNPALNAPAPLPAFQTAAPAPTQPLLLNPPQEALPQTVTPPPAPRPNPSMTPRQELPLATNTRRPFIVVIDPGHGGKDPGAISPSNGLREKDVALSISKRLQRHINSRKGMKALLTRNDDIYLSLPQRIKIARQLKADIFISIHADSVKNQQPRGSSVYILSTKGASSQLARYLAKSENDADLKWGVDVDRYDDDLQQMLLNIQQEGTLESSSLLAERALQELSKIGNVHKKRVERANFVVLRAPEIPSMLVETAFISNPHEARLLATPEYQEKIAASIAQGVERFFHEHLPQHLLLQQ